MKMNEVWMPKPEKHIDKKYVLTRLAVAVTVVVVVLAILYFSPFVKVIK
jgi:hypothetical protein